MFERGDYVKVEFRDESGGETEWMWVCVTSSDDSNRLVFGTLDNEPAVLTDLRVGMELVVSYDKVREHMKPGSFNQ
jgi:uncharacterized protein YegJ (DUF2314 family)